MNKKQKKMLMRIIITFIIMIALYFLKEFFDESIKEPFWFILYMIPYFIIGHDILKKAFKGIINRQVFDECFLMAVATVGAIALALLTKSGDYTEAVAVMLFYQVGEFFQTYAVRKSRKNISELMDIRPDYANVIRDGVPVRVDPSEVSKGEIIEVNPGEKVPIDGKVVEGKTTLDTAALTGESVPRTVNPGDDIISGCVSLSGVVRIETTKDFGESTVSKILELVENSSSKKSKSENFISKFSRVYTPAVCYGALALALIPPIVLLVLGQSPVWTKWIYRALTFLVISCPCALVISIPLTFFAGIGGASHEGILVKGSNYLEAMASVKYLVFDKTGTLTKGVFEVTGIHQAVMDDDELLKIAAHTECKSSHPIAKSIISAYGKDIDDKNVSDIEELGGYGITSSYSGMNVAVGNSKLMDKCGVAYDPCPECRGEGTTAHISLDGKYAGHIVISDRIKDGIENLSSMLKKAGVRKTVMLTGDSEEVARAVADRLHIDEVHAGLLPGDKVDLVEKLLSEKNEGDKLAFVGDGINDAPVLRRADIGIAMGSLGSDAAIEAADVVIMDDDPRKVARAIEISRKCLRIVYENIYFALGIKGICLLLGAVGIANMWMAIFADVGVMVIAVLNAIRALKGVKK